jgi:hypothetical protein
MAAWTIPPQGTRRRAPVGQADATKRLKGLAAETASSGC